MCVEEINKPNDTKQHMADIFTKLLDESFLLHICKKLNGWRHALISTQESVGIQNLSQWHFKITLSMYSMYQQARKV